MSEIQPTQKIITALLQCCCHLGGDTSDINMRQYIFGVREDKISVIDIDLMWKKMILAARAFLSIPDSKSVVVVSNKSFGRKAVLKFCEATGATPITGRFIPGGFSNFEIPNCSEPKLLLAADAFSDNQTIEECAKTKTPVIAFCNTDNALNYIDIAIPMNNRSPSSLGAGFYILSRIILFIKNGESLEENLRNGIESFIYRDSNELEALYQEAKREQQTNITMQGESVARNS